MRYREGGAFVRASIDPGVPVGNVVFHGSPPPSAGHGPGLRLGGGGREAEVRFSRTVAKVVTNDWNSSWWIKSCGGKRFQGLCGSVWLCVALWLSVWGFGRRGWGGGVCLTGLCGRLSGNVACPGYCVRKRVKQETAGGGNYHQSQQSQIRVVLVVIRTGSSFAQETLV